MNTLTLSPLETLTISILVLYLGMYINGRVRLLANNNIPPSVTGGLIFSTLAAIAYIAANTHFRFDMHIRDFLLLVFFSTIGLSAKVRILATGGRALMMLVAIAAVFLILQDVVGVGLALASGNHPGYGLMAGSISFAGGHGTAIAWSTEAEAAGLHAARELGITFATFGLVAGGVIGGPIAKWLIRSNQLQPNAPEPVVTPRPPAPGSHNVMREHLDKPGSLQSILGALLVLALCVQIGALVNTYLFDQGVLLPGFLTAMLAGIVITNLSDVAHVPLNPITVSKFGQVSLSIFLSMSLMSMELWSLASALVPIILVLLLQTFVMTLFAIFVVFRLMGRDYDAAVIAAGFSGLGLGATPVAIANMDAITTHYGPSPKAFLVIPLVGAFFIDLLNAATIKFFISLLGA